MSSADHACVRLDDQPTVLPEELPDPFAVVLPQDAPHAVITRTIQRDGMALGVCFDDAFAGELADVLFDALRDDAEAALDLASFVFDADVRRALAG